MAVFASSKCAWDGRCVCLVLILYGLKVHIGWISCQCGEVGMVEVYFFEVDQIGCGNC